MKKTPITLWLLGGLLLLGLAGSYYLHWQQRGGWCTSTPTACWPNTKG